tara:strand:- start:79 stop:429 length:351 start_codon:yes stop_codon:yes gene_type:complete
LLVLVVKEEVVLHTVILVIEETPHTLDHLHHQMGLLRPEVVVVEQQMVALALQDQVDLVVDVVVMNHHLEEIQDLIQEILHHFHQFRDIMVEKERQTTTLAAVVVLVPLVQMVRMI